jgi:Multiubiquitin
MTTETNESGRFRIIVDQRSFDWPKPKISGADIKGLAGVDVTYGVWQEKVGSDDAVVPDFEEISLNPEHVCRFFTGSRMTTQGMPPSGEDFESLPLLYLI